MKLEEFIEKTKSEKKLDLSSGEDLSIAIMNLISIEEHLAFTIMKTGDKKYFNILNKVRECRKKLLEKIVKNPTGEEWCISKHLLGASMRLIETGNKYLKNEKEKEAHEFFNDALEIYSLFWAINLNINIGESLEIKDKVDTQFIESKKFKVSDIFKKLLACCKE